MPNTELSVVGECVAKEMSVVGGAGEGYGFMLRDGIDNDVYLVTESACSGIEIDATEIIVY